MWPVQASSAAAIAAEGSDGRFCRSSWYCETGVPGSRRFLLLFSFFFCSPHPSVFVSFKKVPFNIIQSLLRAGVDPNPRGSALTPLQMAARGSYFSIVKLLLNAAAHVNNVGDDEAIVESIKR